jgi:hypothetical protein
VSELSSFEVEIAIEKLKRYNSPGIDQISAELIQAGRKSLHSEIHKLINPISNKEVPPESLRMQEFDSRWTDCDEISYWGHSVTFVYTFQFRLKSDIWARRPAILTEVFLSFPQSL